MHAAAKAHVKSQGQSGAGRSPMAGSGSAKAWVICFFIGRKERIGAVDSCGGSQAAVWVVSGCRIRAELDHEFEQCATTVCPIRPVEALRRLDSVKLLTPLFADDCRQGLRVAQRKVRRIRPPHFPVHWQIAGEHRTAFAESFDDWQVEAFGIRGGDESGGAAVAIVELVIPHVFEPEKLLAELRMASDAFNEAAAVPAVSSGNRQPHVGLLGPQPIKSVESQRVILAGRYHADHQIGVARISAIRESCSEYVSHFVSVNCAVELGPDRKYPLRRVAKGAPRARRFRSTASMSSST